MLLVSYIHPHNIANLIQSTNAMSTNPQSTTGQTEATAPSPLDVSQPGFHLEDLPSRLPSPSTSSQKHPPPPSNSFTHYPQPTTGQTEATAPPPLDVSQPAFHLEDLPSRLPSPSTSSQKHPPPSNSFTHYLHLHTHLTLFSLLGTLTRLGLLHLTTYPSAPLPPLFWPQFAGSLIMGFLLEDKSLLFPTSTTPSTAKTSMPLYLGLTSGYCGSVTAFSSFMLGAFDELSNMGQSGRGRKRRDDVAAMLAYVIGTLAVSLAGLQVGAHLAVFARGVMPRSRRGVQVFRWIDILAMPLSLALWIAATLMSVFIKKWRGNVLFACVFSPPGAILRFWISRWGNPLRKSFPLGTFMVNMLGTAVLAGLLIGRYAHSGGGGDNTCGVLRGLGDGFCGCLTTVSTFVVEIRGLMTGHTYIYAGASIVVGLCLMILILGSYIWVDGAEDLTC